MALVPIYTFIHTISLVYSAAELRGIYPKRLNTDITTPMLQQLFERASSIKPNTGNLVDGAIAERIANHQALNADITTPMLQRLFHMSSSLNPNTGNMRNAVIARNIFNRLLMGPPQAPNLIQLQAPNWNLDINSLKLELANINNNNNNINVQALHDLIFFYEQTQAKLNATLYNKVIADKMIYNPKAIFADLHF